MVYCMPHGTLYNSWIQSIILISVGRPPCVLGIPSPGLTALVHPLLMEFYLEVNFPANAVLLDSAGL